MIFNQTNSNTGSVNNKVEIDGTAQPDQRPHVEKPPFLEPYRYIKGDEASVGATITKMVFVVVGFLVIVAYAIKGALVP